MLSDEELGTLDREGIMTEDPTHSSGLMVKCPSSESIFE